MTRRVPPFAARAVACLALGVLGTPLVARDTIMPVSEVRPGMVGIGRTVFRGAAVEDFTVRIIGTLKSVVAPQRDLILAKLEGGPLADTGVIAGMSGSPVYIDGKLIGAVSYQLGQFPKEPIAGITPIGEMTDATALVTARALRPAAISLTHAVPASDLLALWRSDLGPSRSFGAAAADVIASLMGADLPRPVATDLRPIAVPLVVGGFDPGMLDRLVPSLTGSAFVATQAPQAPAVASVPLLRLAAGDAIGIALMAGDFSMGATGTVTQVDGDRVYAFGHPLYNLGPTQFPMTRADVIAVLPSLATSSKLASLGAVVGTMSQDRATAIAGRLGAAPVLVPVTVTLTSGRAPTRRFSFAVVNDQLFTPLLTYLAVANVLTSYQRQTGAATYIVRGDARIAGQPPIRFDDVFVGDQGPANASAYVAGPLTALYRNATEKFTIDGITLAIDAAEETRTAEIERVWLDDLTVRAGRPATVHVQLRTFRGEAQLLTQTVDIPANASGTLQLLVTDGTRLGLQEATRHGDLQSVSQIVRAANRARRDHRVYVRLSTSAPGAVIDGEPLPGLPASVAAVIDADRPTGGGTVLRLVTRGEWELPVPFAVSGSRQLTLTVDPS